MCGEINSLEDIEIICEKALEQKDVDIVDMNQITVEHLKDYIQHLEEMQFKAATVSRNIASIRSFFQFLQKKETE